MYFFAVLFPHFIHIVISLSSHFSHLLSQLISVVVDFLEQEVNFVNFLLLKGKFYLSDAISTKGYVEFDDSIVKDLDLVNYLLHLFEEQLRYWEQVA
jgi:hypothetical protein